MKLPNGYGSVYKLSGKRRKPWVARVTVGWKDNGQPIYQFIGYYKTKTEGLQVLAEYNKNPYDLNSYNITFEELYAKWSESHYPKLSNAMAKHYMGAFKAYECFWKEPIKDLKLLQLQTFFNESGKNKSTLKIYRTLLSMMMDFAVKHEIVDISKKEMIKYLDIEGAGTEKRIKRVIFSDDEIQTLWSHADNSDCQTVLFLLHTGLRVSEFFNLKKKDVYLDERYFVVTKSKTKAGLREVPIADKLVPIVDDWLKIDESEYLYSDGKFNKLLDHNFRRHEWKKTMDILGIDHHPHDCRHTLITKLTELGVDSRIIKQIVGHASKNVTESVYTHITIDAKLDAVNKL